MSRSAAVSRTANELHDCSSEAPGWKTPADAQCFQFGGILIRDDSANYDQHVVISFSRSNSMHARHDGVVRARKMDKPITWTSS